jgi:hypothetical protein
MGRMPPCHPQHVGDGFESRPVRNKAPLIHLRGFLRYGILRLHITIFKRSKLL